MSDDERTTGTPSQDGGDARGTETTGTPGEDGRNASGESGISRDEALAWKAKAEKLNALERQFGPDFESRLNQPPAGYETETTEPEDDGVEDPDWKATLEFARKGDPVARLQVKQVQAMRRREMLRDQLDLIGDPKERSEVRAHFIANQHRLGDIKAAQNEIKAQKLEARTRELEQQLAAQAREPAVNRDAKTALKESPNGAPKQIVMSRAELEAKKASLPMMGSLRLQQDVEEGRILLKG